MAANADGGLHICSGLLHLGVEPEVDPWAALPEAAKDPALPPDLPPMHPPLEPTPPSPAAPAPTPFAPPAPPSAPKGAALEPLRAQIPAAGSMGADPSGLGGKTAVAAETRVLRALLQLARGIRAPRTYVGYSAFVLFALRYKTRLRVWEGTNCIDLLKVFAPWAIDDKTKTAFADAVACALCAVAGGGRANLVAISDEHPLYQCRHFVAATQTDTAVAEDEVCASDFEQLYASKGVWLLGTVLDGDCAIDVMTQMAGLPSTYGARCEVRRNISDYLIDRAGEPWMRYLMVLLSELEHEDVMRCGEEAVVVDLEGLGFAQLVPHAPAPAVAETDEADLEEVIPEQPDEWRRSGIRPGYRMTTKSSQ